MASIETAVRFALDQNGKPYRNDAGRFGPGHFDCSGLVVAALRAAGFGMPPSVAPPNGSSVSLLQWGIQSRTHIAVELAIRTRGALLIRGGLQGWGAAGHVCFSLGDGKTMEAMSTSLGCRTGSAYNRGFADGMLVPTADGPVPPTKPPDLHGVYQALHDLASSIVNGPLLKPGAQGAAVRDVQFALVGGFGQRIEIDGDFGDQTEQAVMNAQRFGQIEVDGEVGGATRQVLSGVLHAQYP